MMKDVTSHQRHSKLLYIICLHLRNLVQTTSYSTRRAGLWKYNYYKLLVSRSGSVISRSVVVLVEVPRIAWKWHVWIRELTIMSRLWTIWARMRPRPHKGWKTLPAQRRDTSNVCIIHASQKTCVDKVQVTHIQVAYLNGWCKSLQCSPVILASVIQLHA